MAGRNRIPPHAMKGPPPPIPAHDRRHHHHPPPPHFPMHPALLDELREGGPPPPPPHFPRGALAPPPPLPHHHQHAAIVEERLAAQFEEIQALLVDNQRLAATHVALKQELAAAQHELRRVSHGFAASQADMDLQLREVHEKAMKMETELRAVEAMRMELIQVRSDIQKLNAARQELTAQAQALNQDLTRASAEMQQAPAIKAEIDTMKQEVQRVRAAIEFEKKGYAENYEQGQVMEKNLISMAREVEKLRAEVANAEKRARAAAAVGNQASVYGGNYGNPEPGHGANPYPAVYGMNPVPGAANAGLQYGSSSWGAYDMQRAHGQR
ncbi:Protein FLX-like 1 [Ananas comosus]|uniref:Protein FLX-like 1 n=1 Tax=Ananas comosus TaxID=4615 RepID=A0A199W6G6_ANACO|nr:Protein FLX-like 1 [Ananas comosus]